MVSSLLSLVFALVLPVAHAAEPTPPELQGIGLQPKSGSIVSLALEFKDEAGQTVGLKTFFNGKKPVVLAMAYYECPNLCTLLLNGAAQGLGDLVWKAGEQYEFVVVSIDARETPELAAEKKKAYFAKYGRPGTENGWHFLTGSESTIRKLADEIGFEYRWDEATRQFAHPAVLFLLTPQGKLARTLGGVVFNARDLRLAMTEASEGKIGTMMDKLLLLCFRYDPKGSRYGFYVSNTMKGGAALTLLLLGWLLWSPHRKKDGQQ